MKTFVLALLLAIAAPRAGAADAVPADVAAFTRSYLQTMQEKGMAGIVPLLHPDAQAAMKEQLLEPLRAPGREYAIKRDFGPDAKLAELEDMAAEDLVRKLFAARSEDLGDPGKMMQAMEIIGVVSEGETQFVVVRSVADVHGQKITNLSVTPLRRYKGEWRAMLTTTREGTRRSLERPDWSGVDRPAPPAPPPPPSRK
jgi:hypothetical protein